MNSPNKNAKFAGYIKKLRMGLPLRENRHVYQHEVAEEARISLGSYQRCESGIIPGDKIIILLARYFNVSEEMLLNPPEEEETARLIYKGVDGEDKQESRDKEGLFGKTRHVQEDGAGFAVTTHEPKIQTAEARAITTLVEMLHSKERQLLEQTGKIKSLKVKCESLQQLNDELNKRISTLEAATIDAHSATPPPRNVAKRR